jgi:NitT/TauT family transport system permease protein
VAGVIRKVGFVVVLLAVWEGVFRLHIWPPLLLPGPESVARSLVEGFANLSFPVGILVSMGRMIVGYAIAVVIGVCAGLAIARYELLKDTIGSAALGLQTLPSVCWLPLALLWFGLSERAILFVVVMGATFCITTAVNDGIRNVQPVLLEAGRNLGATGLTLQWRVVIPAALPTIVTGLKLGWSFAWRSLMAGELLYSEKGLGRILTTGRDLGDMSQVIAAIIMILVLGLTVNRFAFAPVESLISRRWGLQRA